ncbi:uncharacterized protein LOC119783355 isoform X2 [Cyprinodon tularosa]|uniref:uncharacterized protein LOC119783355 isoform X2 n=1 Tax=Cyprinodon tularosa TaxID=77115 RepID=UPI0018E223F2|nr:uncharacterized protein LOC119783355 isoform X2 [Cyprinodon tularosa]
MVAQRSSGADCQLENLKRFQGMFKVQAVTHPVLQSSVMPTVHQNTTPGNTVLRGQSAQLIRVNGSKTLLSSAYLEHRTKAKEIRVIAIVLRSEKIDLWCHLLCRDQLQMSKAIISIHSDHFRFPYGTADIMCQIPSGCEIPSHVAITSSAIKNKEKDDLEFLEINNQKAQSNSFPYNFTTCFSAMYNFTNVLQLVQTLEMLQLLGVNRVVIYKTNCSTEVQRVLEYYSGKGLVEVIPWSMSKYLKVSRRAFYDRDPADIHYFAQIPALNDCLYRYMYQSKYMALHDPDELILPQSVNSWLELLPMLEKKHGADSCYNFETHVIPSNFVKPPPEPVTLPPQDLWQKISGENILTHLYREPFHPFWGRQNYKIIINPRAVFELTVHGVLKSKKSCAWVDSNIARIYHIKPRDLTELKPDQMIYDGRLLSYSSRLSSAVNTVLRQTGILPASSSS